MDVVAGQGVTETVTGDLARPRWRGRIHAVAAVVAVPLFVVLVTRAGTPGDRLACAVYGIGVTTMLTVSAIYHAAWLPPRWHPRLRRADHSTILLAIAGSYSGIGTLALDGAAQRTLLWVVWVATAVGVAIRMVWLHAPYPVIAVVYVVVGWSALVEIAAFVDALSTVDLALVVGGGVVYTAGAVVYALHRPNPWPATFGYHEVFHALVVTAAALHYLAALRLV